MLVRAGALADGTDADTSFPDPYVFHGEPYLYGGVYRIPAQNDMRVKAEDFL